MKFAAQNECPICHRRRGGKVNHEACSKAMQKQKLEEIAKPRVKPDGTVDNAKTEEQYAQEKLRQAGKQYKRRSSEAYWSKFD